MSSAPLQIVGIGASAGGIEAFRRFFENMPPDTGLGFVVVLHLAAGRKSMLPEIMARWTRMPVSEARDGEAIAPDHVYVIPGGVVASLHEGALAFRRIPSNAPREPAPIDAFFDSMATSLNEDAIGVVLSGTGHDAALGLKAIRTRGGLTLAQGSDGSRPEHAGMPDSAVAVGAVDLLVPVEEMPGHITLALNTRRAAARAQSAPQQEARRLAICEILRARIGHDFSQYKAQTFMRRVQRRMQVLRLADIADYVARLEADRDQVQLLFRDLLISVTSFFRDGGAFAEVERAVVPRLFQGKDASGQMRVWVPGCATGEEAYSIAILLREHMDALPATPEVQVFASDIDDAAIATARAGHYPASLLEGMSGQRRSRFFVEGAGGSTVRPEIRELCTFSAHSLIRDPPFSRIDAISCRNLLIYMDNDLQDRVIPIFHYALVPGGILILGSSETLSRHEWPFAPVDRTHRIFMRRKGPSEVLGLSCPPERNVRPEASAAPRPGPDPKNQLALAVGHANRRVLERFAAAFVVADAQGDVVHYSSHTGKFLEPAPGTPTANLFDMARPVLRLEIQSVNEELNTVNAQLSAKVEEHDRADGDLRNLFESAKVATVFLDPFLVIRSFTPEIASIYNLIPSDLGRPLTDIVSRLDYPALREDVQFVLRSLEPLEKRVDRADGSAHYLMRILPYRAPDNAVDGSLVTLVDVTSIVRAEEHQRLLVDELNHRVKNMLTVVISPAANTVRRSSSLEDFSHAFLGRIHALSSAYALLSRKGRAPVPLREVLAEQLRPFAAEGRGNVTMAGPGVRLEPVPPSPSASPPTNWRRTRSSTARCRRPRAVSPSAGRCGRAPRGMSWC